MNVQLSVVIPVFNEQHNIGPLLQEVAVALRDIDFEILCVNDDSQDDTLQVLQRMRHSLPMLRVLHHRQRAGQSTAVRNGVKAARGRWITTLDGDGQNDPADIPKLLQALAAADASVKLVAGWRVQRRDSASKRWASRWANRIRRAALNDDTPDTGCGIKLFERDAFLDLPYFDHMHRYLPALIQRAGWRTLSVPVGHRPRMTGQSKYNNISRALAGIVDLCGVAWLRRRARYGQVQEIAVEPPR